MPASLKGPKLKTPRVQEPPAVMGRNLISVTPSSQMRKAIRLVRHSMAKKAFGA